MSVICKEMHRVVMTCWDFGNEKPYAEVLARGICPFNSKEDAYKEIEHTVKDELEQLNDGKEKSIVTDSDGNEVGIEYPFRADDTSVHDMIVRFWDGDDYENVTAYDIHKLEVYLDDEKAMKEELRNFEFIKYRGFYIYTNPEHTFYRAESFDTCVFQEGTLEDVLDRVDDFILAFSVCEHKSCTRECVVVQ